MQGLFDSARRKIIRAHKHFDDMLDELSKFFDGDSLIQVVDSDPDDPNQLLHKVKLVRRFEDTPIAEIVGDIASNLRASLDHAIYAIAATRSVSPRKAYFPFCRSAEGLEKVLKDNCKDVPVELYPFLRSLKPYEGGDDLLYALNAMRNADNHAYITPVVTSIVRPYTSVKGTGYMSMPLPEHSTWDHERQEVVLLRTRVETKVEGQIDVGFLIKFCGIEVIEGKPVLDTLSEMGMRVDEVLDAIEAEARRLGFTN